MSALADDHVAIQQLLARYARGIDRLDRALIRSAYWDDAIDDHGVFCGGADAFVAWVCARLPETYIATGHVLGQSLIDLRGDEAMAETYFRAWHLPRNPTAQDLYVVHGRYLDHLQRRDGAWRIYRRQVVRDLRENPPSEAALPPAPGPHVGAAGQADPSYAFFR